jgi:pyruvate,water dikinase
MNRYIRHFSELRATDRPSVGGKCASLGEMVAAGLPVPEGFAVTTAAFEDFLDHGGLRRQLRDLVDRAQAADPASLRAAYDRAVALIGAATLPEAIAAEIHCTYERLGENAAKQCGPSGAAAIPVAVRSSSVDEDGDAASFAGQQETYLWVNGRDAIVERVRDCWASLFTPQAIAYRKGLLAADSAQTSSIGVGIQAMVGARVAGVTFTVSPRSGDRSVMAINASWGLGQAVVSGEVTPDEFWLSKIGPVITSRTIADKAHEYVPSPDGRGVLLREVDAARRGLPCLDREDVLRIAELCMRVEKHYGHPVDIEWAMEEAADQPGRIMLLQCRPETNWKKRLDQVAAKAESGANGIFMDLLASAARSVTP